MPRRPALVLLLSLAALPGLAGRVGAQGLSPVVEQTEALFAIVLTLALLVGLVVYGTLAIAMIRFRSSRSEGTLHPTEGNRPLEAAWSAIPALLLVGLTVVSTQTLLFIETNPANAIEIGVTAQQWSWQFSYPDGRNSSELWLERGATFLFTITSKDVVHSFYLPEFQVKKDAVPGVRNYLWLRPDAAGRFHTQCAEYCGLGHSDMVAEVVVFEHQDGRPPYGPPAPVPPTPRLVELYLEELGPASFRIEPARLNFTIGEYVRLRVHNNGSAAHGFTIDAPYNVSTGPIPTGSFRNLFLNFTSATMDTAFGGNAGERANGMVGTLVVTGGRIIDIRLSGGAATPFLIDPAEIRVPLNEVVIFRLHNVDTGNTFHNFSLLAPYNVRYVDPILPGETATLGPMTLDKEARVRYICAVGGHEDAGMVGILVVGNPREPVAEVIYPLFDFALSTFLIGGLGGMGYLLHHARSASSAGRRGRER